LRTVIQVILPKNYSIVKLLPIYASFLYLIICDGEVMKSAQVRITMIFEALHTTANAFARIHNMNVPTLYGFVNGTRSPGFEILTYICAAEPRISAEFLLRGEGEPLRDVERSTASTTVGQLKAFKEEMDHALDKRITELGG
jgi:hypothetical protein